MAVKVIAHFSAFIQESRSYIIEKQPHGKFVQKNSKYGTIKLKNDEKWQFV